MAAKSVIQVDVDPEGKFKAFYDLFQKYQKQVEGMPEDWKKVTGAIDDAEDPLHLFAKHSDASKEALAIAAAQAEIISRAIQKTVGVQDKLNTKTKDGAKQMGLMARASKEMHKDISTMSGVLLKLGALGGAALSIPTAIFASTNAVANQNLQARGLGLRIGQTQAFDANFERFGLGTSDLGNVANAQSDTSRWRAFMAAGLTPQQIQNEDTEQLTYDFARAASAKYRQWEKSGMPAATMAQAYGFTDILSLQQLRTGASYDDAKWVAAQRKEMADAGKMKIDQGTADQASDVKAALKSDWAQVINTFNEQLAIAAPEIKALGGMAAAAATKLLGIAGPEFKSLLDAMEHPGQVQPNEGRVVGGLRTLGTNIRSLMNSGGGKIVTPTDSLASVLDAQYSVESSRGKHLLSRKGAMGPMQFMPDTWKEWGHGDVNNLHDAMDAARRYDTYLLKRYGGDVRKALAAYNWGMGNLDKDIAKHGAQWERYAPTETQNYVNKIAALMAKGGQNVNVNISNSTPARVAVSQNAAQY